MAAVAFDTLKLARQLEAAGFPARQAQDTAAALAEAMTATIATAADLRETELRLSGEITGLRGEIREAEARLRGEIGAVELRLGGEIAGVRGEIGAAELRLRGEIAGLRTDMAALRAELIRWVVGSVTAGVLAIGGLIVALLRVLPHG